MCLRVSLMSCHVFIWRDSPSIHSFRMSPMFDGFPHFPYGFILWSGKVHGSLARAGKVKSQTPKVEKADTKKKPRGRANKRLLYVSLPRGLAVPCVYIHRGFFSISHVLDALLFLVVVFVIGGGDCGGFRCWSFSCCCLVRTAF